MNTFLIQTTDKLLVVYQRTIFAYSTDDYRFLFREILMDFVLDYAINLKKTSVLLLLNNGRVLGFDSSDDEFYIAGDLNLFHPQMHSLSYSIRYDPRSGFLVSSPFDGKETAFCYDSALKHYTYKDTRVKSDYASLGVLDRSELMVFSPDGQVIDKLNRKHLSVIKLPDRKFGDPAVTDFDPDQLNNGDLYPYIRFACSALDDESVLLTMIDGIALVRAAHKSPEIVKSVRYNNPLYAMWSEYSKDYFIVQSFRGELSLFKDFEEIMLKTDVQAYCFLDEKTLGYLDEKGVHIMDLKQEMEIYLLPLNKNESSFGWRSYDDWETNRYYYNWEKNRFYC